MEPERIARLTEAQKVCLRLVLERAETKEIARQLGISHTAVTERLRLARHTLGVSRSIDAARALSRHESPDNKRLVDMPTVVEPSAVDAHPDPDGQVGIDPSAARQVGAQEERAEYLPAPSRSAEESDLSLRIPLLGGKRDDLKTWQVICWCLLAGALVVASFGLLLKIDVEVGTTRAQQHH